VEIGFFWLIKPDKVIKRAAKSIKKSSEKIDFHFFALEKSNDISKLENSSKNSDYESINYLQDICKVSQKRNFLFAIISFGRGIPTNEQKLLNLLDSKNLKRCIWSFRISDIAGVGMKNPPRLPYVDDHFIILNVKRGIQKDFFSRKFINASHFSNIGFQSSVLTSMIEYSINPSELNNHFYESESLNEYGEKSKLNPFPFNFCRKTGFISFYPEVNKKLFSIFESNFQFDKKESKSNHLKAKNGNYFLKRKFYSFSRLVWIFKKLFPSEQSLQPQKKYR